MLIGRRAPTRGGHLTRGLVMAGALALGGLSGCRAYHPLEPGPGSDSRHYVKLLLVTRAGDQLEIFDAVIRSDSIVGTVKRPHTGERVALARDDVVRMESAERDAKPAAKYVGAFLLDIAHGVLSGLGCVFSLGHVC